ncbi:MAG: hypothetical protein RQM90_00910 [Methanoculleus sp.]
MLPGKALVRGQRTLIDRMSIEFVESVFEILVRGIKGGELRSSGKHRLPHVSFTDCSTVPFS